jgi:hypothetical protein
MLSFILAVVLLALSAWGVLATVRRLRQTNARAAWWLAFALLMALGAVAGAWFAFRFEYRVSPDMRFAGFPVPVALFHLEDGHWVDFIIPPYAAYPAIFADILSFGVALSMPLLIARRVPERRQTQ